MTTDTTTRELIDLTVDECIGHLYGAYLGRLAFAEQDRVEILPLNFRFSGGAVVFRTGFGTMLDAVHGTHVAFEIDGHDDDSHTGWSVVVHGLAEEVWRPAELREIRELPLRPWAPGEREHYVRILPSTITGRRIGVPSEPSPTDEAELEALIVAVPSDSWTTRDRETE